MTDRPSERWTPVYERMFSPEHELAGDPVCRRWAFADLCNMARFEDGTRIINGTVIPLKRGELVASLRFLAQRWTWSVKKVRTFLDLLHNPAVGKLETVRETQQGTVYRIVSYDTYATPGHTPGHGKSHDRGTPGAHRGHTRGTNNTREYQGVPGTPGSVGPAPNDALSDWLNGNGDLLPDSPVLADPTVRQSLYQQYGPPSMRGSAWKRDDGSSVPTKDRPKIMALALSDYLGLEGKPRIVAGEFDGVLRRNAREQAEKKSGWLYDDEEGNAA